MDLLCADALLDSGLERPPHVGLGMAVAAARLDPLDVIGIAHPQSSEEALRASPEARSVLFAIGSPPKAGSMTATNPAKRPDTTTNTRVRAISSR